MFKTSALIELRGAPGRVLTANYLINLFQETRASTGCFRGLGFSTFLCPIVIKFMFCSNVWHFIRPWVDKRHFSKLNTRSGDLGFKWKLQAGGFRALGAFIREGNIRHLRVIQHFGICVWSSVCNHHHLTLCVIIIIFVSSSSSFSSDWLWICSSG